MYAFWESWQNKSNLEEKAIRSLLAARKIIITHIPKQEIVAIYVKGSFVRREMIPGSDVDTVTILKTLRYLPRLKQLEKKHRHAFDPNIQITGYSLWELRTGRRSHVRKKNSAAPSRFSKYLDEYKIIHGTPPTITLHMRTDTDDLKGMIKAFRTIFIPDYTKGKMAFSELAKQVFWLTENEERVKGHTPPHHWKRLAATITDKNHLIHTAISIREGTKVDKEDFLKRLSTYLTELEGIK